MTRVLFGSLLLLLISSCSTPAALQVNSSPDGADVFASHSGGPAQKLGKTPLTIGKDGSSDLFSDNVQLTVSKDGYATQSVALPRAAMGASAKVSIDLKEVALPTSCSQQAQSMNAIADGVAHAQYLIYKKNYEESKRLLMDLTNRFPDVAALYNLLGNTYYLEKDLSSALDTYKRAQAIEPDNPETLRLIEKISAIRGRK